MWFYNFFTSFQSIDYDRSLYYANLHYIFTIVPIIIPLLFTNLSRKSLSSIIHILYILLTIALVLLCFYSILLHGFVRNRGLFSTSNVFGAHIFAVLLNYFIFMHHNKSRYFHHVSLILVVVSFLTLSRSLFIVILFLLLLNLPKGLSLKLFFISILSFFSILTVINRFELSGNINDYLNIFNSMRFFIWYNAVDFIISNNMLALGSGYETGYIVNMYTDVGYLWMKLQDESSPVGVSLHSSLFKIFITHGVMGSLIWLFFFLNLFRLHKKIKIPFYFIFILLLYDFLNVSIIGALGSTQTIIFLFLYSLNILYFIKSSENFTYCTKS